MIPAPADLLAYALATYYLAITATKLLGPFAVSERLRHRVYRARGFLPVTMPGGTVEWFRTCPPDVPPRPAAPPVERLGDDWVAEGISCPLCGSLYAGLLVLLLSRAGAVGGWAIMALAVAGGSSFLYTQGRTWE